MSPIVTQFCNHSPAKEGSEPVTYSRLILLSCARWTLFANGAGGCDPPRIFKVIRQTRNLVSSEILTAGRIADDGSRQAFIPPSTGLSRPTASSSAFSGPQGEVRENSEIVHGIRTGAWAEMVTPPVVHPPRRADLIHLRRTKPCWKDAALFSSRVGPRDTLRIPASEVDESCIKDGRFHRAASVLPSARHQCSTPGPRTVRLRALLPLNRA